MNNETKKLLEDYRNTIHRRVSSGYSNAFESGNYVLAEKVISSLIAEVSFLEGQLSEIKQRKE